MSIATFLLYSAEGVAQPLVPSPGKQKHFGDNHILDDVMIQTRQTIELLSSVS